MQQLYLTGQGASAAAERVLRAINAPTAGFRLTPFSVSGEVRGEALHFLLPPPLPLLNDVPCRIRIQSDSWQLVPKVMEQIAVPGLRACLGALTPVLVDAIHSDMLAGKAFCAVLDQLQAREHLCVFVVAEGAEKKLRRMMPPERQRWFCVTDVPEETLIEAVMLRLGSLS